MPSEQQIAVTVSKPAASLPAKLKSDNKRTEIERITPKVRTAIEAMVWQALPRSAAAEAAGISEHGLYKALRKAPVRAFYLAELDVLRTSERARNIHTLAEVRDQTSNQMARVQAVKALEQISDDSAAGSTASQVPGVVVQIINTTPAAAPVIQHDGHSGSKPLITLDGVRHDGQ
jgi:hypothetical protein